MKPEQARKTWYLAFTAFVVVLPLRSHGWEPNARDRNAAVGAGNLTGYFRDLTSWLDRQVPADGKGITPASMKVLFAKRAFMAALAERHFIAKAGDLGAFAKANPKNKQFVAWVLAQSEIMDEVLLACTPSAMFARIDDSHMIDSQVLEDWKEIIHADPTSREGLYARLAAACALRPPGTANQGAGRPEKQSSVMDRYRHYRMAHANQELFPSFDGLSVWELTHVVSAGASNADLAWGREMVNTFLPSAKQGENVVSTTSLVKNQGSQIPYSDMSCILAGGGKCGPRSSFGVFINQAWGIPSIRVGQPGHAAVCWRGTDGKWQVGYGRAWDVSKVADRFTMSGAEFLEMTDQRTSGMFAQIEHLRWIAALLEKPASTYLPPADRKYANPRAAAVMAVAGAMGSEVWQAPKPNQYKQPARPMPAAKAKVPLKAVPGVIHVEAADFFAQGTESVWDSPPQVPVWDSCDEGKQLGFHLNVPDSYVGFKITVPKAGLYELTARV